MFLKKGKKEPNKAKNWDKVGDGKEEKKEEKKPAMQQETQLANKFIAYLSERKATEFKFDHGEIDNLTNKFDNEIHQDAKIIKNFLANLNQFIYDKEANFPDEDTNKKLKKSFEDIKAKENIDTFKSALDYYRDALKAHKIEDTLSTTSTHVAKPSY